MIAPHSHYIVQLGGECNGARDRAVVAHCAYHHTLPAYLLYSLLDLLLQSVLSGERESSQGEIHYIGGGFLFL